MTFLSYWPKIASFCSILTYFGTKSLAIFTLIKNSHVDDVPSQCEYFREAVNTMQIQSWIQLFEFRKQHEKETESNVSEFDSYKLSFGNEFEAKECLLPGRNWSWMWAKVQKAFESSTISVIVMK